MHEFITGLPWFSGIDFNTLACSSSLILHAKGDTLSKELAGGCPWVLRNELRSLAALLSRSKLREAITTQHPNRDSSLVIALPIPVPPPVTMATLSRKRSFRNTLQIDIMELKKYTQINLIPKYLFTKYYPYLECNLSREIPV